MPEDLSFDDSQLGRPARRRSTGEPLLVLLGLLVAALAGVGICVAAIVARAPAALAPLVAAVCVGGPLFAGWEVPAVLTSWRADRAGAKALAALRRGLEDLPETEHPLGL